jgi:hypothetical protein
MRISQTTWYTVHILKYVSIYSAFLFLSTCITVMYVYLPPMTNVAYLSYNVYREY